MKGYLYILICADGSFYTGSTNDLERRLEEHQNGEGANHTRNGFLLSWFIRKSLTALTKPITAKGKYMARAETKRLH